MNNNVFKELLIRIDPKFNLLINRQCASNVSFIMITTFKERIMNEGVLWPLIEEFRSINENH